MNTTPPTPTLRSRFLAWTQRETTGGLLLLAAAAIALLWSNSPWRDGYTLLSEITLGPESLHLNLSLAGWATDGLLAIFFFVVGVELAHEFTVGGLRDPRTAAVPMLAAAGGMIVPALVYTTVILATGTTDALGGWAIPTATDIAFALGVLAIFGRGLPAALRTFLLTLAVVDDLLAIVVIAVFYTAQVGLVILAAALAVVTVFAIVVRRRWARWWILLPLGILAWGLMHASGVHATIAGVLLGLSVPARALAGESASRSHRYGALLGPFSTVVALPVFAFFAAGVTVVGGSTEVGAVALAISLALVVGKLLGVLTTTALVTRFTRLRLPDAVGMRDLLPIGLLTGIGFTVSLLIAQLSFPDGSHSAEAKIGVLAGTLVSATLAAIMLRRDAGRARSRDMNRDGIPDVDTRPLGAPDDAR